MLLTEPRTQLPPRHWFGPVFHRTSPHIYSPAQIDQILKRTDRLGGRLRRHCFRCLIGLLASTGLRISEALRLRVEDVDLQQAVVMVRESKYGKSRAVPLHRTAITPLRSYVRLRQKHFPVADHFFVSERGAALGLHRVQQIFKSLREGIPYGRRPPRLHDFRHTHASSVLQRWQKSKAGAFQRIPLLCRYLGHAHATDTYWYLTALPKLLRNAARHFGPIDHGDS